MSTRRGFIKETLAISAAASVMPNQLKANRNKSPIIISTWDHGLPANKKAWELISAKGRSLDAVEAGVRVPESDPDVMSVGYGGRPDRDGKVTLDACIMDEKGNCGSVAFIQNIKNPISLARLVMEKTKHVMMVGKGAEDFAFNNGFKKENLLTDKAKKIWEDWKTKGMYDENLMNIENHDTIGMLAQDSYGNISGACTTSGLAWKLHGRVGDSPLIGSGLYSDNDVGAACATGTGEAVIRVCGSFLVVELMRNGMSPNQACKIAIERISKNYPKAKEIQVGFLAINKAGDHGAFALQDGFKFALTRNGKHELIKSDYLFK